MSEYQFKTKPFKHQMAALEIGGQRIFFAFLMEMGTGKSKVLIDNIGMLFEAGKINAAMIIAPKTVCQNWASKEIPEHLPERILSNVKVVLWAANQTQTKTTELKSLFVDEPLRLHILVMNVDAFMTQKGIDFAKKFMQGHDTLMAIDESTTIKSPSSKRSKAITKAGNLANFRRILTGSVAPESPLNIFQQFQFLEDGCLGTDNFYAFRNRFAVLRKRYINGRTFDQVTGYQNVEELSRRMKEHAFIALKKDCLDLPPKVYETRQIELTPKQRQIYEKIKEEALFQLNDKMITAPLVLTRLLRLRQVLCNHIPYDGDLSATIIEEKSQRIEAILEILDDAQCKTLIWSNFKSSIREIYINLQKEYGAQVGVIHGAISIQERQKLIEAFQNGDLRVLIMHPRTAGHGITLTAAELVIYHDNDWSLELRQQSEDRAHRIGQKKSVTYVDLIANGTIDEKILKALKNKRDISTGLTGEGWKELFA